MCSFSDWTYCYIIYREYSTFVFIDSKSTVYFIGLLLISNYTRTFDTSIVFIKTGQRLLSSLLYGSCILKYSVHHMSSTSIDIPDWRVIKHALLYQNPLAISNMRPPCFPYAMFEPSLFIWLGFWDTYNLVTLDNKHIN